MPPFEPPPRDLRSIGRVAAVLAGIGVIVVVLIVRAPTRDSSATTSPESSAPPAVDPAEPAAPPPSAPAPQPGAPAPSAAARPFNGEPIANGNALFDRQLLIDAGLSAADAQRLRDRFEAYQTERAAQVARARSEGRQQQIQSIGERLDQQFRQELGEEMYDFALYGAGDFNRIRVQAVPPESAAAAAGVQVGDLIRRYAEQAVWSPRELVDLAGRVAAGRRVALQVERAGRLVDLQIDSGALGAALEPTRAAPGAR